MMTFTAVLPPRTYHCRSVNYRRSPVHPFPTPYDNGTTTLKFICDVREGSVLLAVTDLSRCFIACNSAGGNMAHHDHNV
ncbi:unnamed protein product [Thlaspi arvense]|uniref:Alpha/beta hydrolase fold-3 domain-containing protein n=1 Tax=Thlaspi arvense TaxID=13288 RepID=A0AAU9RJ88_THLAR|nr:unnamed protein product [Thlaspi arvense]